MFGISVKDYDKDGNPDIIMGGNFYESKPEVGIYDASYGVFLKGNGKGEFATMKEQQSGFMIKGAVRDIASVKTKKKELLLIAKNNGTIDVLELKQNRK